MQKPNTSIEQTLPIFMARHAMLTGVRRLGIAVSGGSDSVALLRLLLPLCREVGITPVVLHLDHGLRGAASVADARFVARLAKRLGVECQVSGGRCQVEGVSRGSDKLGVGIEDEDDGRGRSASRLVPNTHHPAPANQSLEMAAREARQKFFRATARKNRLDAIATGHTADDVAETLLLRLARGSGATGLSGLRPVHTVADVKYIRPLLDCTHEELRVWLRRKRQVWCEDASNSDERIPRNRLRHTVLPWMEQNWSPSIRAMLVQSAAILRDEDALLDALASDVMADLVEDEDDGRVRKPGFRPSTLHLPPTTLPVALQRRILRQWLMAAGYPEAGGWHEIEGLLSRIPGQAAWQVSMPGGVQVQGKAGMLTLAKPSLVCSRGRGPQAALAGRGDRSAAVVPQAEAELPVPGHVDVAGVRVTARRTRGIVRTVGPVGVLPSACSLDVEALRGKVLQVRTRRAGDRIQPLGLNGSKTLQDLFVDGKVPAEQRDRLPLLVVDGEVVWVPGYRVAKKYAVRGPRAAAVRVEMWSVVAGDNRRISNKES